MRILLAAILALLPTPALADVTARYTVEKEILVVEADDGGNARFGIDGKFNIIRRDGYDYVAMTMPTGETKVTELGEFMSMMSAMMATEAKSRGANWPDQKFVLAAKGDATVAGHKGTLWTFGPEPGPGPKLGRTVEAVMSSDPTLAPIGAIFRRTLEALLPVFAAMVPEASGFAGKASDLFGKGAPLSMNKMLTLQSVSTEEINPKRFELPAPVISAVEFMQAMEPGGGVAFNPLP